MSTPTCIALPSLSLVPLSFITMTMSDNVPHVFCYGPTAKLSISITRLFHISRFHPNNPQDSRLYIALRNYFLGIGTRTIPFATDPNYNSLLVALHTRSSFDHTVLPAWQNVLNAINEFGGFDRFHNCGTIVSDEYEANNDNSVSAGGRPNSDNIDLHGATANVDTSGCANDGIFHTEIFDVYANYFLGISDAPPPPLPLCATPGIGKSNLQGAIVTAAKMCGRYAFLSAFHNIPALNIQAATTAAHCNLRSGLLMREMHTCHHKNKPAGIAHDN